MREIKFRVWDIDNMVMSYKITAYYPMSGGVSVQNTEYNETVIRKPLHHVLDRKNIELMQYTGLKDKHGKEIWEGDIIKHYMGDSLQTNPSVVKWNSDGGWSPWLEFEGDSYTRVSKAEVIGNIYSNPELLKEY